MEFLLDPFLFFYLGCHLLHGQCPDIQCTLTYANVPDTWDKVLCLLWKGSPAPNKPVIELISNIFLDRFLESRNFPFCAFPSERACAHWCMKQRRESPTEVFDELILGQLRQRLMLDLAQNLGQKKVLIWQ